MSRLEMRLTPEENRRVSAKKAIQAAGHTLKLLEEIEKEIAFKKTGKRKVTTLWQVNIYSSFGDAVITFFPAEDGKGDSASFETQNEAIRRLRDAK